MKEDQSNKKKGWFDFLRPSRSALSRSEFNALFDQRNYYSRELEDIANQGAKTLVDEWALETSKKASKQLQSNVSLPDFRFLPDVQWNNGVFTYNVNDKEVTDDKETQVSRLIELSNHYGYSLPDKAEDVVLRDRFNKILHHYYKDNRGNIYEPEPSGDLRLNLNNLHLLPGDSNKAYSNITMEDFSKIKLFPMSMDEVYDFKERSQKAVDGDKQLKQVLDDIKATRLFNKNIPDSLGLRFNTNGSPISFSVDSYHASDKTLTLFSHKAMQNGSPVHLNIDKYNAWQYTNILARLDDHILALGNKDIKEMNDVVRHLEELSKDIGQQFITHKDKDTVRVDYRTLTDNEHEMLFNDAGGFERSLDRFYINGNRSVEIYGTLTKDGQDSYDYADSDNRNDADYYKVYAKPEQRQFLLNALKAKEEELLVLPMKQKGAEIFEALKYKCSKDHLFKGNIPIEEGINFRAGTDPKNYIADTYKVTDNNIYLYANKDVFTEGWAVLQINKNNAWKCLPQLEAFRKSVVERECEDIKEMNKVADHLAELTKDKEKQFPTRDSNGNLAFDASNITKNGDISFYVPDEYGEARLAKAFIITGNRSVDCAIYDNRLIPLGEEGRRKVLDAMKHKERELEMDLKQEDLANEEKRAESRDTLHFTSESSESPSQTQDKNGQSVQSGRASDVSSPDGEMADDANMEHRGESNQESREEASGRWHTPAMKENDAYRVYSKLLIAKMGNQNINENTPWVSKTTGIPKSIDGKKFGGIAGLMLAMNTEKEGYDLPIYLDREEAASMQLKLDPFAVTFPVIGKDGKVNELYNIDQTDFREQHPRQYEQFAHDNSAEIRIKENEAVSLNTLATNGLWYVPVKEDGKENLAVYSLADKAIHIAPMENYRENKDNYYRDLTIAMVSSTRLNNTNSGFKRYLKEDLISHLGSAMLSQKYRFSFNANNPDVSHFWKDMLRNNANTTKSVLQAAEASANRVYSRVEEISRSEHQGEDDSLDLQSTTPGTGDADGDGIADDQENYAPEKRNLSSRKDDSLKQERTVRWHK